MTIYDFCNAATTQLGLFYTGYGTLLPPTSSSWPTPGAVTTSASGEKCHKESAERRFGGTHETARKRESELATM